MAKAISSGDEVVCNGQTLYCVLNITSGTVTVNTLSSDNTPVRIKTLSTSQSFTLPGHVGCRYTFTFTNAVVDVYGAS